MSRFYYDEKNDAIYVTDEEGVSGFIFFLLLSTPFFIAFVWLQQYAMFANQHKVISSLIYLMISVLWGMRLYTKRRCQYKFEGILAVVISMIPCWMLQILWLVPMILSDANYFEIVLSWGFLTFFSVGISFFIIQISLLKRNGQKHLISASVYLMINIVLLMILKSL